MQVYPISVYDVIETNTYFYIDETTKHGFLIDPAAEAHKLIQLINDNNWIIEKMLITHGHFDHIGAVETIHQELGIPYFIYKDGKGYLLNPNLNLSSMINKNITLKNAQLLEEGDLISINDNETIFNVIHTPGHTPDSIIFYDKQNNIAFVGDTIFKNSIGRTDFPGGNSTQLKNSIETKLLTLPSNTILYSGHTEPTTVEAEQKNFKYFF